MPHCKRKNSRAMEYFIWIRLPGTSKVGKGMVTNCKRIRRSIEFFALFRCNRWEYVYIQVPANSGSIYYNYKKNNNILYSTSSCFWCQISIYVSSYRWDRPQKWLYSNNSICKSIDNNALNFPQPKLIGNYRDNIVFPYVFVADKRSAMKPNRFVLIPEVMPLMKQNMSSVIVFLEQGGLLKTI